MEFLLWDNLYGVDFINFIEFTIDIEKYLEEFL